MGVLTFEYKLFSGLQEIIIFALLILVSINLYNIYKKQGSLIDFLQCILISNILKSSGKVLFEILWQAFHKFAVEDNWSAFILTKK